MEEIQIPKVNVLIQQFDAKTGELLSSEETHNLVVNSGLNLLRNALYLGACSPLTKFGLGTSSTPVVSTHSTLQAELFRHPFTSPISVGEQRLTVFYYLTSGYGNGQTIREAGLFAEDGTMYARVVLPTAIPKTNLIEASFTWTLNWGAS